MGRLSIEVVRAKLAGREIALELRRVSSVLTNDEAQGIELIDHRAFSFQGHPEASPGPQDICALFDRFVDMMASQPELACA